MRHEPIVPRKRNADAKRASPGTRDAHNNLRDAAVAFLSGSWPRPANLTPALLGKSFATQNRMFVDVMQSMVDDGLITVEAMVSGNADGPIARDALLTRKGATSIMDSLPTP